MVQSLADYVKHELEQNYSLEDIRKNLLDKGFIEDDIDRAVYSVTKNIKFEKDLLNRKFNRIFGTKEFFDRAGYGLGSTQVVNILFSFSGASYLLIGLINGLRAIFSNLMSGFLKEYNKLNDMSKTLISVLGILFGFSFMLMAMAVRMKSPLLFSIAIILGAIGVVGHGDLYRKFLNDNLSQSRRSKFLRRSSYYGVMITMIGLLLSGILLDLFPFTGTFTINLFGQQMPLLGYVLVFVAASIMFILSGYVLAFVDELGKKKKYEFSRFFREHYLSVRQNVKIFTKNKVIFLLFFATTVTGLAQVLGASYYGIFVYDNFSNVALGGFMNVVIIFLIALIVSFIGPSITKYVSEHVGEAPMLVFGTLLIALLNLVLAFNPNLLAIGAGVALATIGSAIVGVAQGLIALKILRTDERKQYFSALSFVMVIPFIIGIPLGSVVAQYFGLQTLFLALGAILIVLVAPVYFIIVLMSNKTELVS
ncbi:MAG: MFS transporter [Candidatus Ranarchaeia archaeon]